MEIGDIFGLDDFEWKNWKEDLFLGKTSSSTSAAQPAMELNGKCASAANTHSGHFSKSVSLLAVGGDWSVSTNGSKDPDGNSKATVEGGIQIETDNGNKWSTEGGCSLSSDKDQNIEGRVYNSFSFEGHTDSGISYGGHVKGEMSTEGRQSFEVGAELKGKF